MTDITILTPTYNRCNELKELYNSLENQTYTDFVWMIIDDGSSDNTEEVVKKWCEDTSMKIVYKRKENGGKHTAINFALEYIETILTFIVDSDDFLSPDAVEIIEKKYNLYKSEKDLCGFSFLRGKRSGGFLSNGVVPCDGMKETFCECRINRNITGDMAEVWYTNCLKEYPFPEFEGERFISEDCVWIPMSEKYKLRFFNNAIYISDYLSGGLTNNRRINNIKSPNGCVKRAETFLKSENIKNRYKLKPMIQYIIYGKFANKREIELFEKTNKKGLYIILYIPSKILYLKWKGECNKNGIIADKCCSSDI